MKYALFVLSLLILPVAVFAQEYGFVPLTQTPFLEQTANSVQLSEFLNNIYRIALGTAAVIAVLQIMRAGIMYMGGDSVTEKKEAKNLIGLSIAGLVLVLSPVVVFSIINPEILSLKIDRIEELNVDLRDIATGTGGTGSTTASTTLPSTERGLCSINYVERRSVAAGESCSSLGTDWETVSASCCLTVGQGVCCGRRPQTPEEPQTGAGFRYRIAYQDTIRFSDDITQNGRQCVAYVAETLRTQTECVFAEQAAADRLQQQGKDYQFIKRCINNELPRHRFSDLPSCPQ